MTDVNKAWIEAQAAKLKASSDLDLASQRLAAAEGAWQAQPDEENGQTFLAARLAHRSAEDAYKVAEGAAFAADKALFVKAQPADGLALVMGKG